MRLLRIVGARFDRPPALDGRIAFEIGQVHVESLTTSEEGKAVFFVGDCPLRYAPKRTGAGLIVVPDNERRQVQVALEAAVNLVSISEGTPAVLSSPNPYVAFRAEDDDERAFLESSSGIDDFVGMATHSIGVRVPIDQDFLTLVSDRFDGVALLAEALSARHPTGQFHEYVRLFERAFARAGRQLSPLMEAFLQPRFGYTGGELDHWFRELRDPATHADQRPDFVLQGDVRLIIARMRQAAYDVLLNKTTWRDDSTDRRAGWFPAGGTTDADGSAFMLQHSTGTLIGELSDQWGDYALDLESRIRTPREMWPGPVEGLGTREGAIEVIPHPDDLHDFAIHPFKSPPTPPESAP